MRRRAREGGRAQHVFASCGDCGQSRVKEDEERRTTNRATKLRHVEWEMDAAAAKASAAPLDGSRSAGGRQRKQKAIRGNEVWAAAATATQI